VWRRREWRARRGQRHNAVRGWQAEGAGTDRLLGRRERHDPRAFLDEPGHEDVTERVSVAHEEETADESGERPGCGRVGRHLGLSLADKRLGEVIEDPDGDLRSGPGSAVQDRRDLTRLPNEMARHVSFPAIAWEQIEWRERTMRRISRLSFVSWPTLGVSWRLTAPQAFLKSGFRPTTGRMSDLIVCVAGREESAACERGAERHSNGRFKSRDNAPSSLRPSGQTPHP